MRRDGCWPAVNGIMALLRRAEMGLAKEMAGRQKGGIRMEGSHVGGKLWCDGLLGCYGNVIIVVMNCVMKCATHSGKRE